MINTKEIITLCCSNDTDLDGQNDYNDLISLDYDIDVVGKINFVYPVNPNTDYYTS